MTPLFPDEPLAHHARRAFGADDDKAIPRQHEIRASRRALTLDGVAEHALREESIEPLEARAVGLSTVRMKRK